MRVHLGSDHAGFELKAALVARLAELGHEAIDHGPKVYDAQDDYPPYVMAAAAAAAADPESLGIVIGGSGNGEAIAANKVAGVRCALAFSDETAQLGRLHNNANVVSLGARMYPLGDAVRYAEIFVSTAFSDEPRHVRRLQMLTDYERTGVLPSAPVRRVIFALLVRRRCPAALARRPWSGIGQAVSGHGRGRDSGRERTRVGTGSRMPQHQVALGGGHLQGSGTSHVTGPHGAVDADLGRSCAYQSTQPVFAVSCVMLVAIP